MPSRPIKGSSLIANCSAVLAMFPTSKLNALDLHTRTVSQSGMCALGKIASKPATHIFLPFPAKNLLIKT